LVNKALYPKHTLRHYFNLNFGIQRVVVNRNGDFKFKIFI